MHAEVGDWLVVQSRDANRHARHAAILEVHSKDGTPPYLVRWMDDGREALVFPGPDARVVSAAEQEEIDRIQAERAARMQAAISSQDG